jgi:hypothetical protein
MDYSVGKTQVAPLHWDETAPPSGEIQQIMRSALKESGLTPVP